MDLSRPQYVSYSLKKFYIISIYLFLFAIFVGCYDLQKNGITNGGLEKNQIRQPGRANVFNPVQNNTLINPILNNNFIVPVTNLKALRITGAINTQKENFRNGAILIHTKDEHVKKYAAKKDGGMTLVDEY